MVPSSGGGGTRSLDQYSKKNGLIWNEGMK